MTHPHLTAELQVPDVASAISALRDRGLRLSSARRLVLEALFAVDRPVTAEEIAGGVGGRLPKLDLASVYRNLERLEELGIVRHTHVGHSPGLYAPAGSRHEHVVCERCGARQAVDSALLDGVRAAVRAAVGWEARFDHFPLAGLCPRCQTAAASLPVWGQTLL